MAQSLNGLIENLKPDPWRKANPFSADIEQCNRILFDPALSRAEKALALNSWLQDKQPCLFGRYAAKQNWITYCVLNEVDLDKGDEHVRDMIRRRREQWKRDALSGKTHGFIIAIISEQIAYAQPSNDLLELCRRLSHLYLSRSEINTPLLDEVALRVNGDQNRPEARAWKVGVNWFGAQADKRWWHDHRIPGGVGLSMNSVGHMARRLAEDLISKDTDFAHVTSSLERRQLVSWAIPVAMRTILTASKGAIPGTRLMERGGTPPPEGVTEEDRQRALGQALCPYSEDEYFGWYDTDATILPEYFDPSDKCPRINELRLPFTYLHRQSDRDYMSMGLGTTVEESLGMTGFGSVESLE